MERHTQNMLHAEECIQPCTQAAGIGQTVLFNSLNTKLWETIFIELCAIVMKNLITFVSMQRKTFFLESDLNWPKNEQDWSK